MASKGPQGGDSPHTALLDNAELPRRRKRPTIEAGWKPAVRVGACVTALCLAVNTAMMIWVHVRPPPDCPDPPDKDSKTLFCGSCEETTNIRNWAHLAINVCATLMLATSTNCAQVLSAPTRDEIDRAHAGGHCMDVGVLSFANLRKIDRRRSLVYLILLISSMPIHFLYNSVILSTQGVYDTYAILASPAVLANSSFTESLFQDRIYASQNASNDLALYYSNNSIPNSPPPAIKLQSAQYALDTLKFFRNNGSLGTNDAVQKMDVSDCLSAFQSPVIQNPVVMLIATGLSNDSDLEIIGSPAHSPVLWSCFESSYMFGVENTTDLLFSCSLTTANENAKQYNMTLTKPVPTAGQAPTDPLPSGYFTIDHCLVRTGSEVDRRCSIVFSTALMSAVVFVNAVKLSAIIYTVGFLEFRPLVTVGDAVVSFLKKPDALTRSMAPHSDHSIKASYQAEAVRVVTSENRALKSLLSDKHNHGSTMHFKLPPVQSRRWFRAASRSRWLWMSIFVLALYAGLSTTLGIAFEVSESSIGPTLSDPLAAPTLGLLGSLLGQVLLANLPQYLISVFYVSYMGVLTTMLVADELCRFTTTRKAMRVTPPRRGQQRSSYFLQVPYRYSVPVLIAIMALHWLVSEAVFVIRLMAFDVQGQLYNGQLVHDVGYTEFGIVLVMGWGFLICLFPVLLGFRKLRTGMPLMNNNSLAISIACHPFAEEAEDGHEKPLIYGLVESKDTDKPPRIGFTAGQATRLTGSETFEAPRCLSTVMYPEIDYLGNCSMTTPTRVLYESWKKRL